MRLVGKILFVCYITSSLAALDIEAVAQADESRLEPLPARRYVGRWFGPKSPYVPFVQTWPDSCWRRRVIAGPWGPVVQSKWICGNIDTYSSVYDYGYGRAPADRLPGYPSWWR
jgi:hypothetical protein